MNRLPRGIANANPGNIRHGDKWQGLAKDQKDPDFCTFNSPFWGIRAMARILLGYQQRRAINTVQGIIERWAPPVENDTGAYVKAVAHEIGINPEVRIDLTNAGLLARLVAAIVRHENGQQPYSLEAISEACAAAIST